MKKLILSTMGMFLAFSLYAKDIQELVVTTTPPMSCQNCENKIKGNLRFEKGVKKIETNLKEQRVTIEYDAEKTTPTNIEEAFQKIGYKVDVIDNNSPESPQPASTQSTCNGECCKAKKQQS